MPWITLLAISSLTLYCIFTALDEADMEGSR
jgi:hypothetical protein